MKRAIIIGASSGIGEELAKILSNEKYESGLMARRSELLFQLQGKLSQKSYVKSIDIAKYDDAMIRLNELRHNQKNNKSIWQYIFHHPTSAKCHNRPAMMALYLLA